MARFDAGARRALVAGALAAAVAALFATPVAALTSQPSAGVPCSTVQPSNPGYAACDPSACPRRSALRRSPVRLTRAALAE